MFKFFSPTPIDTAAKEFCYTKYIKICKFQLTLWSNRFLHIHMTGEYYRHFKGNIYRVLHIAKHSETLEDMVVYQAMYGERGIWVRPLSMFEEEIERDGKTIRRFSPITQEEAEEILCNG